MRWEDFDPAIERLYTANLRLVPGERVLVLTDRIRRDEVLSPPERTRRDALPRLAERIATLGKRWGKTRLVSYPAAGSHGEEPPTPVWEAGFGSAAIQKLTEEKVFAKVLAKEITAVECEQVAGYLERFKDEAVDVVIALANFSTSHTQFRTLVTTAGRARYASMPLFAPEMFAGPMAADWPQVAERSEAVARRLTRAESAEIQTPAGTRLRLSLGNRQGHADTGLLWQGGNFGNLPAGEAYIAPVEETAEGRLVIEHGPTGPLEGPISIPIHRGRATAVEGHGDHAAFLAGKLQDAPLNGTVAELGVGTNDRAINPYNILEAEKILGTVHVAFGDNSTFGGTVRTPFHLDHVLFRPTLTLSYADGSSETLLKDGTLQNAPLRV
ncbi:MAG: aminopeptidase [Candidatus Methylomirabilales bacterium]